MPCAVTESPQKYRPLIAAFFVLPAFLRCNIDDDVFVFVLRSFDFCVPSEAVDEALLNMMFGSVSFGVSAVCGTRLPNGCAVATHSLGEWEESVEGDPDLLWGRSPHLS